MIIDANAHLGHYPFRQLRHNTAPDLLALMNRNGIDKAVVASNHAVFYRDSQAGNEELAATVAGSGGRLIPIATINPNYAAWEEDFEQSVAVWGMKAVRLLPEFHGYRLSDKTGQAVLAAAAERNLPVALPQRLEDRRQKHAWDQAADLTFVEVTAAVKPFPSLKVLFQNWLGLDGQALRDAGLHERCLIDFGRMAVVMQKHVPALIESFGVTAIAFGSHVPFNYFGPALVKLSVLDVPCEDRERIAWRNIVEFLALDA